MLKFGRWSNLFLTPDQIPTGAAMQRPVGSDVESTEVLAGAGAS